MIDRTHFLLVSLFLPYLPRFMLPEKIQPTTYVFAEYANSPPWIAAHIGQFVGEIIIFAEGFVALFRLLVQSKSMTVSVLAWIGFTTAIIAASTFYSPGCRWHST